MTRDDIIRMAREAGLLVIGTADNSEAVYTWPQGITDELERFAALVAEAERERLEATAWGASKTWIDAAVAAEREECAKVCEAQENRVVKRHPVRIEFDPDSMMARKCAAAIRARGEK